MLSDSSSVPRPFECCLHNPIRKSHLDDIPCSFINKQLSGTLYGPGSMLGTEDSQITDHPCPQKCPG